MDVEEKEREDLVVLTEIVQEFSLVGRYTVGSYATDELSRGLCEMIETKHIPIWLSMAASCFLDIHHVLRDSVDRAFSELQEIHDNAKKTVDRFLDLLNGVDNPRNLGESNQDTVHYFSLGLNKHLSRDVNSFIRESKHRRDGLPPLEASERFYLHNRQPILCGIIAFRIVLDLQHIGIRMASTWGTAIYPAHLYNALRQKKNPINPWPLMEEVISIHGAERIFVGARPIAMLDCFKQVSMLLGYSASQWAMNRRNYKTVMSKNGSRGLKHPFPLGVIFRDGLESEECMASTVYNIERLLNEQARDAELTANPNNKSLRREWKTTKRLTPLQVLQALRKSVRVELPKLEFDYFHMHEQSVQLLRTLRKKMDAEFVKTYGHDYLDDESQLPWLAPLILMSASTAAALDAEESGVPSAGSKMLDKAGKIVEKFVKEQLDGA